MKFKVSVTKTYFQEHIVEADDAEHAKEIGSEISCELQTNRETFFDSSWEVLPVGENEKVTYEPVQEYLK